MDTIEVTELILRIILGRNIKVTSVDTQVELKSMHYAALANGMRHFKETEEHDNMSEAVERYAKEYAKRHAKEYAEEYAKECVEQEKTIGVKNLMENLKFTLEQALNALGIQGEERELIKRQLQKQ